MTDKGTEPHDVMLSEIRTRTDSIDAQLLSLLNERAQCALDSAKIRQASSTSEAGVTTTPPGLRSEQAVQMLHRIVQRNSGPLDDLHVKHIFREIISASQSLEEPVTVAFLGPQGTYSEAATYKHFGHAIHGIPQVGIADIFTAVESGQAHFGVVPIENSTEGAINITLDLLMGTRLQICGEVWLRIHHQLLSTATRLEDIVSVHSHPQSLAQCRSWLDVNLPQAERISESSNAAAAKLVVTNPRAAAIAGTSAATHYDLHTLAANIEDVKNNTTRFIVIGHHETPPSGEDSTSILISAPHKPGGLRRLLKPLEEGGFSMTRIESRPQRDALWEYVFFIDVKGHQQDPMLASVLLALKDDAAIMRVLGSYPSAL